MTLSLHTLFGKREEFSRIFRKISFDSTFGERFPGSMQKIGRNRSVLYLLKIFVKTKPNVEFFRHAIYDLLFVAPQVWKEEDIKIIQALVQDGNKIDEGLFKEFFYLYTGAAFMEVTDGHQAYKGTQVYEDVYVLRYKDVFYVVSTSKHYLDRTAFVVTLYLNYFGLDYRTSLFVVKPGECVYIGGIKYTWDPSRDITLFPGVGSSYTQREKWKPHVSKYLVYGLERKARKIYKQPGLVLAILPFIDLDVLSKNVIKPLKEKFDLMLRREHIIFYRNIMMFPELLKLYENSILPSKDDIREEMIRYLEKAEETLQEKITLSDIRDALIASIRVVKEGVEYA